MRSIVDVPDPENPGKTIAKIETKDVKVINIRQKKTGAKVAIPCSPDLIKTLERYIKANELETVKKITEAYDYFK